MRIYGKKDLTWLTPKKGNQSLWHGDNYILAIVPHETHEKMYIAWPDGTKSKDFYNISRAKNHAVSLTLQDLNLNTQETPLVAPTVRLNPPRVPYPTPITNQSI